MPVPAKREDEFMSSLLDGLDESHFSSPTLTPLNDRRPSQAGSCGRRCKGSTSAGGAACSSFEHFDGDAVGSASHDLELQAIEDLLQGAQGDSLLMDMENFSPSPKRRRYTTSPGKKGKMLKSPLKAIENGAARVAAAAKSYGEDAMYVRCRVDSVLHGTYIPQRYVDAPGGLYTTKGVKKETVDRAMRRKEVVLHLTQLAKKGEPAFDDVRRTAVLRDEWVYTSVQPGDIVHLIGRWKDASKQVRQHVDIEIESSFSPTTFCSMVLSSDTRVDLHSGSSEADNLIILQPDVLLSATAISSAVITCARKPLLQAKVKPSGPGPDEKPTEALVMGRMLHEVLQSCLTGESKAVDQKPSSFSFSAPSTFPVRWTGPDATNFAEQYVKEQICAQIYFSLDDLLHVGLDTQTASERLWERTLPFGPFASTYLRPPCATSALAEAIDSRSAIPPIVRVVSVHDVEEDIWSPMYGLKGFVDVSVEVEVTDRSTQSVVRTMMPLELKTGRSINLAEHRAQTMLYTLMMSDRYRQTVDCGLLYYTKSSEMHLVRSARHEIRGLVIARNELASFNKSASRDDPDAVLDIDTRSALPPTIDDERTCSRCYVVDSCMLYRKAIDAAFDEAGEQDSPIAKISAQHTDHLTPRHLAFFRHWDKLLTFEETDVVHHRREMWTMTARARERAGRCYADMVLVEHSTAAAAAAAEYERGARMTGSYSSVYRFERRQDSSGNDVDSLLGGNLSEGDAICVSVEPSLLSIAQGFLLKLTPRFIIVGVDKRLEPIMKRAAIQAAKTVFRIDREEQVSGMARTRYNLAKLFFAPPAGDARRRELVVDLRAPRFSEATSSVASAADLNEDQRTAVANALRAEDYALIVGMPGTGKTTTIACLVDMLAKQGKTVLLASYTHSAVDTICRKLLDKPDVRFVRIGSADRVHKDVQGHMLSPSETVEQLYAQLLEPNVVATTCLSIGHVLFAVRRTFDYCIIDEASQITLPTCLGPLRYAAKFVLVGDPQQLPPLVRDARARQGGFEVSLFERLQKAHPNAASYLCHQYRMNEDIMTLSNTLTYAGRLRCGDQTTERQMLSIYAPPPPPSPSSFEKPWMARALQPSTRTLFVNTDEMLDVAHEERTGDLVENTAEAKMAVALAVALIDQAGVRAEEIAILTPYRQQIRRITHLLQEKEIEVWTADKAQGRDKDVVIVSFVRSFPKEEHSQTVGQLLHDERRINVTLTRARKKLILLGSKSTLTQVPILRKLWTLMEQKEWTITPTS